MGIVITVTGEVEVLTFVYHWVAEEIVKKPCIISKAETVGSSEAIRLSVTIDGVGGIVITLDKSATTQAVQYYMDNFMLAEAAEVSALKVTNDVGVLGIEFRLSRTGLGERDDLLQDNG